MKKFFLTLSWRLPTSSTPASTSLLIMYSTVFSIHPLKSALVLLPHIPATPALSPPTQGQVSTQTVCSHEGLEFVHLLPELVLTFLGEVWDFEDFVRWESTRKISIYPLPLLPTVLRVDCVNPRQRDWWLSSHSDQFWKFLVIYWQLSCI